MLYVRARQSRCLPIVHQMCRLFVTPQGFGQGRTNTSTREDDEGYQVAYNLSSSDSKSSIAMEGQTKAFIRHLLLNSNWTRTQKDIWGSVMFELSFYLLPSHSLYLKFIQGLFSLWAFLTCLFHVGVYPSSFYDCIIFGLQKELFLLKKRQKGFTCRKFNHKL